MKSVALGFSGGVDSAVSAILLKNAGFDVLGIYLDNAGEAEKNDAMNGADAAGIPLKVIDVHGELESRVCSAFENAYFWGETPNPCIICNPLLKFRNLLEAGCDYIATGHYAKASADGAIYKGHPDNDQSYMLCRLTREQAGKLILPLGEYSKVQVREMAKAFGLPVASKPDSMEICFIPDKDYISWLEKRPSAAEKCRKGSFVLHGDVIGEHEGIYRYTVGQRLPGLIDEKKVYISGIDAESNEIQLAFWDELFKNEVYARDFSWLCDMEDGFRGSVRVRHTKWENPDCTVYKEGNNVRILCDEPVRAPAAGQSAVIYCGEKLIGGGFIA